MNAPFAWAFATGMAATVNPCGFALLPTYLTYYLGLDETSEDERPSTATSIARALKVSGAMTAGFLVVFGTMGLLWGSLRSVLQPNLPFITIGIGTLVVVLGVAMLAGYEPTVGLPKLELSVGNRQLTSMFFYGISYAVASLSCTLPLFAGVLTSTLETSSPVAAGLVVATFGLGMGLLLAVLTMAVALGRTSIVRNMRRVLPWIQRISGGLLVIAGLFVAYYGWTEYRITRGDRIEGGLSVAAQDWQGSVQTWVVNHQATLGWVSGALVIAAITWITIGRLRGKTALNKPVADAGSDGQGANRSTRHAPSNKR
ncbi:MAG: cytochrome c biogenesis protein CcdA [Candidatus Microthrix sp.]|uniref:cytochrome c biogenesis CcdA family protein n=1 Tax=Candidatus Neomicrothrix TaxID=41949 RepID=UPI0012FD833B|nr:MULTISPECIES: cytochrome c biogenesis CcdA family protein [Microthrix]MBL0204573.1 cytochrome c biogenesis protein CcdA [Candidatus Microthrix sp.]MBP9832710.1 cytochrome c biogenesis protein CcdA [Candidatus Microthrix sp.]